MYTYSATAVATFITTDRDGMEWNSCEQLRAITFTANGDYSARQFAESYYAYLLNDRTPEGIAISIVQLGYPEDGTL